MEHHAQRSRSVAAESGSATSDDEASDDAAQSAALAARASVALPAAARRRRRSRFGSAVSLLPLLLAQARILRKPENSHTRIHPTKAAAEPRASPKRFALRR